MEEVIKIDHFLDDIDSLKKKKFEVDWNYISLFGNFSYEFFKEFEDLLSIGDIIYCNYRLDKEVKHKIIGEYVIKVLKKL